MVIKGTVPGVLGERAHVIRFNAEYAVQGFNVILNSGQATALRDNTYVIGDSQLKLLRKAKIPYEIVEESDL